MALSVTVHGITVKTGTQTSGRLATADITLDDGLDNVIYTVPQSPDFDYAIVAISICNREAESASNINLAISDSDLSKGYDFIEWGTTIVPRGVLERTQLVIQPGQRIILRWGERPTELVPDHEILDFAGNWLQTTTGTGTVDTATADRVTMTLAEGDTGSILTSPFAVVDGNTYRVSASFFSTDVTGVNPSLVLEALDTLNAWPLVTLGLVDMDRTDEYTTFSADFTIDNATDLTDDITQLQISAADVTFTLDRISLIALTELESIVIDSNEIGFDELATHSGGIMFFQTGTPAGLAILDEIEALFQAGDTFQLYVNDVLTDSEELASITRLAPDIIQLESVSGSWNGPSSGYTSGEIIRIQKA